MRRCLALRSDVVICIQDTICMSFPCSGTFKHIQGLVRLGLLFKNISEMRKTLKSLKKSSCAFLHIFLLDQGIKEFVKIHRSPQKSNKVHGSPLESIGVHRSPLEFIGLYMGVLEVQRSLNKL